MKLVDIVQAVCHGTTKIKNKNQCSIEICVLVKNKKGRKGQKTGSNLEIVIMKRLKNKI